MRGEEVSGVFPTHLGAHLINLWRREGERGAPGKRRSPNSHGKQGRKLEYEEQNLNWPSDYLIFLTSNVSSALGTGR